MVTSMMALWAVAVVVEDIYIGTCWKKKGKRYLNFFWREVCGFFAWESAYMW